MSRRFVFVILSSTLFSSYATFQSTVFQRSLSEAEQTTLSNLRSVGSDEVVQRFVACDIDNISADTKLVDTLKNEAKNAPARAVLEQVTAKLEPYVLCATSLKKLIGGLPEVIGEESDEYVKGVISFYSRSFKSAEDEDENSVRQKVKENEKYVKKVVFFYNELFKLAEEKDGDGVHEQITGDGDRVLFFNTLVNTRQLLLLLQKFPMTFKNQIPEDILENNSFKSQSFLLSNSVSRNWSAKVKGAILSVFPLLTEKCFQLVKDSYTSSHECVSGGHCIIKIGPKIKVKMIGGPLYFSNVSGSKVVHSVGTLPQNYSKGDAAIHEIHHHLVKCIDADLMNDDFRDLIKYLQSVNCDKSYISNLKSIWTHIKEFRNITGVFIKNDEIYWDPFSEGALSYAKYGKIRASHSDADIKHVPPELVRLVEKANDGYKLVVNLPQERKFEKWD